MKRKTLADSCSAVCAIQPVGDILFRDHAQVLIRSVIPAGVRL